MQIFVLDNQHWTHRNFLEVIQKKQQQQQKNNSTGGSEGKMQWIMRVTVLRKTTDSCNSDMFCICFRGEARF